MTLLDEKAKVEESAQEHPTRTPQQAAAQAPDRRIAAPLEAEAEVTLEQTLRPAIGALMTTLGTAFLVGGMFVGIAEPRIYAALGGIAGCGLAVWAARARDRVNLIQGLSLLGLVFFSLILAGIGGGFGIIGDLTGQISEAAKNARLHRPPAAFDPGWKFVLPLTVGFIGYAGTWIGTAGRKPAVGIMFPQMPIIAFAAIAQPDEAQVVAGIVAFVTFALGLAIIYRADRGEGEGVSTAYELKRAAKAAPLVVVLTVVLIVLSQTGFLFPAPLYDPSQRAQIPRAVSLEGVPDRVIFSCTGGFTGPWRMGVLDVYDSTQWRLPPYNEESFKELPSNGQMSDILGNPVNPNDRSQCTLEALEGTVVPLPALVWGVNATDFPPLVVDIRSQTLRVKEGEVPKAKSFEPLFQRLPLESQLDTAPPVADQELLKTYTDLNFAKPPPAASALIAEARAKFPTNNWRYLNHIRRTLLDNVTSEGAGIPVPVPPSKVEDILAGTKIASPFEIVAAQAILSRWAGIPARIGYGFDGGKVVGARIEYRPKHGSSWLEVYFSGHGWFPVTGLPKQAKASSDNDPDQTLDAPILPGPDISVTLYYPRRVNPRNFLFKQVQKILLLASPFLITGLLTWIFWPLAYKLRRRSVRHAWAMEQGRAARIAVAYADVRDTATDLGVGDPYATPLAYVRKVVPDEEHEELAWLVTRTLWGDLRDNITDDEVFAAEELSRSLRRRLFEGQPFTIRGISLVSRLSLRDPYAPELLSPPVPKFEAKKLFAKLAVLSPARLVARVRRGRAVTEESPDEAVEAV